MLLPKRDDSFDLGTKLNKSAVGVDESGDCDTTGSSNSNSNAFHTHNLPSQVCRSVPTIPAPALPQQETLQSHGVEQLLARQYEETVRVQQVQIESLNQQVDELRALVKQLMSTSRDSESKRSNKESKSFGHCSEHEYSSGTQCESEEVPSAVYIEMNSHTETKQSLPVSDSEVGPVAQHALSSFVAEDPSEYDGEIGSVNESASQFSGLRARVVIDARNFHYSMSSASQAPPISTDRLYMQHSSLFGQRIHKDNGISPVLRPFGGLHRGDRIVMPAQEEEERVSGVFNSATSHFYSNRGHSSHARDYALTQYVPEPSILESESLLLIQSRYLQAPKSTGRNI
jgi:hypothetical protein